MYHHHHHLLDTLVASFLYQCAVQVFLQAHNYSKQVKLCSLNEIKWNLYLPGTQSKSFQCCLGK
jgi:hypothetical protein